MAAGRHTLRDGLPAVTANPEKATAAMATTSNLTQRIETVLDGVTAETDSLPELAASWEDESDVNRYVWDIEWRELMARLEDVEAAYRAGAMTAEQQARYHTLRQKLRTHLPLLEQLGLTTPSVPLEF